VSQSDSETPRYLRESPAPEWVIAQTRDRLRRELEADEAEYEERLAAARKREETLRRKFFARNVKRQVC
jgi:chromosome transmission fidelity protein 1